MTLPALLLLALAIHRALAARPRRASTPPTFAGRDVVRAFGRGR